jgi:outer membrane protein OmpA-like peptidoglycan-associated protein
MTSSSQAFPVRFWPTLAGPVLLSLAVTACATTTPVEVENARTAYTHAAASPAAQQTPSDLQKAKAALDEAERALQYGNDPAMTVDLAYIAERSAQIAEARARAVVFQKETAKANLEFGTKQDEMVKSSQAALEKSREQLAESERTRAEQTEQASVDRAARGEADKNAAASELKAAASEQRAVDANDALAKLAGKEEARGTIITLSGSVLFRSNESELLAPARTRLDVVAAALIAKNRAVVVEGYTDSKGSASSNMDLSRRRAESVRSYLVWRGFPTEKIEAHGMGAERPIAENTTSEGRASNRRVEIVVTKAPGGND